MKHTLTIAVLCAAAACVSPETHRRVVSANAQLQAQNAGLADAQKQLSSENTRLREENQRLSAQAVDAAYVAEMKKKLADLLARYGEGTPSAANGVELVRTREGYAFRVAGNVLFAPGQNALSDQGKRTLTELAGQLANRKIRIEGHTDDQPIKNSGWRSNLHLSVERGMVVAEFLTNSAGIKADNVSVAGYSQYRPAAEGNDEAARSKNRRVEILLLDT